MLLPESHSVPQQRQAAALRRQWKPGSSTIRVSVFAWRRFLIPVINVRQKDHFFNPLPMATAFSFVAGSFTFLGSEHDVSSSCR
jgi:hypothetical protein